MEHSVSIYTTNNNFLLQMIVTSWSSSFSNEIKEANFEESELEGDLLDTHPLTPPSPDIKYQDTKHLNKPYDKISWKHRLLRNWEKKNSEECRNNERLVRL
ncbi:hypothetical protein CEXT_223741 [Caerostris extrusa]|uniref:Uncharacterized protein n=1 Tax=Caerostris extrusa TaxID=172846 RepID=A0AAV4XV87_CAEEX|nr:hypothetical protein CEXT_223741 [Caerostris extrusa]